MTMLRNRITLYTLYGKTCSAKVIVNVSRWRRSKDTNFKNGADLDICLESSGPVATCISPSHHVS